MVNLPLLNLAYSSQSPVKSLGLGNILIWLVPGAGVADLVRL